MPKSNPPAAAEHVHFNQMAIEISGEDSTSTSVGIIEEDRQVNPPDCEDLPPAVNNVISSVAVKKGRGRPKKAVPSSENNNASSNGHDVEGSPKRAPRKAVKAEEDDDEVDQEEVKSPKRPKRGKAADSDEEVQEAVPDTKRVRHARAAKSSASKNLFDDLVEDDEDDDEPKSPKRTPTKRARSKKTEDDVKMQDVVELDDSEEDEDDEHDHDHDEDSGTKKKTSKRKPAASSTSTAKKANRVFSLKKGKDAVVDSGAAMAKYWERAKKTGKYVGAHVSMAGGIENAIANSVHIGGTAVALFLKNQRKWESPPLKNVKEFKEACVKAGYDPKEHILPHGIYLMNMCSPVEEMREKSYKCFVEDLKRCEELGIARYNFHPGSSTGKCTEQESIAHLVGCLNRALKETKGVTLVIENMAGAGAVLGRTFEQLKAMIDGVTDKSRIGVCLDTCHLWAAGFDISSSAGYEKTMKAFETTVGFKYLKGIHINDCQDILGNKTDRHDNIGSGKMGIQSFRCLMNDDRLNNIPMVLETPPNEGDDSGEVWKDEIELLYSLIEDRI
ncbi:hypothetical protein SmJEL517_g01464 [Synchytrium microbalum]|uniref:Apurinic-apyrimidinic endonuclease 1 n=1 Tax=Synchytrium microbalum TaxID=1806994 RepID=A0A507C9H2_9FUNG|nr:uncharacterized protein SmJEL517_g01464 [Synchytrium microbalum]TPX36252.1 hypothetical protein SmJEL517_g01464 [Synchytrium microbalum]